MALSNQDALNQAIQASLEELVSLQFDSHRFSAQLADYIRVLIAYNQGDIEMLQWEADQVACGTIIHVLARLRLQIRLRDVRAADIKAAQGWLRRPAVEGHNWKGEITILPIK